MNSTFSHTKLQKDELRKFYKKLRDDIDEEIRKSFSKQICEKFINSNSFAYYDTIFCYASKGAEVNVDLVATTALELNKRIAFPRIVSKGIMEFRYVTSLSDLQEGTFGIKEPGTKCEICSHEAKECSCVLVPALSFDKMGHRLGYGGGYYDRFLSDYSGSAIGISYSSGICDSLPFGKHDMCVDVLITEGGVISVEKKH